ncbi:probably inactive leucine-rich repeat receptor-like protein kinase At5g48380, partial [Zea mays]
CLKKLKASVDLDNKLEWTFNNNTEGSICGFNGVECWHPKENMVLLLHLGSFGLKGEFPDGLENCSSMTLLDLSSNSLSGPIPADISRRVPFVTNLDLSFNSFLGEIPEALANCSYLNIVNLQHNKLTGTIPVQLAALSRLAQFKLSGQIPSSLSKFTASDFANQDLCGRPLSNDCTANSSSRTGIIIGSAVGGAVITLIIAAVILFIVLQPSHSS